MPPGRKKSRVGTQLAPETDPGHATTLDAGKEAEKRKGKERQRQREADIDNDHWRAAL